MMEGSPEDLVFICLTSRLNSSMSICSAWIRLVLLFRPLSIVTHNLSVASLFFRAAVMSLCNFSRELVISLQGLHPSQYQNVQSIRSVNSIKQFQLDVRCFARTGYERYRRHPSS